LKHAAPWKTSLVPSLFTMTVNTLLTHSPSFLPRRFRATSQG